MSGIKRVSGFVPCPTCGQYSHSLDKGLIGEAQRHFETMISHRGDGIPTQQVHDHQTRDMAQRLLAKIDALEVALTKARDMFREYEHSHRAKASDHASRKTMRDAYEAAAERGLEKSRLEKAERNRELADMCDAALKGASHAGD